MREIINHIRKFASEDFLREYSFCIVADAEFGVTSEYIVNPISSVTKAIRQAVKFHPEEYNEVFAPLFTEEEIKNMKRGKAA